MSTRSCVCAGVCLLLLYMVLEACAHEDLARPDVDDPLEYQVSNEIDAGPSLRDFKYFDEETGRPVESLLDRLFRMEMDDDTNGNLWDTPLTSLVYLPSKRVMPSIPEETKATAKTMAQADQRRDVKQPRWKTRKGRGSGRLRCYFKVCSFRIPI